jgi:hypothetical protein
VTVTRGDETGTVVAPADATTVVQRRSADARVAGGLLLTFGTGWLLQRLGLDLSWEAIIAGVLLALGVAMMVTPRGGHGMKLWFLGLALTLGLASMSSVSTAFPGGGLGDHYLTVHSVSELKPSYEQLGGRFTLDLNEVAFKDHSSTPLKIELGGGQLIVVLPENVDLEVTGQVVIGDIWGFGEPLARGPFLQRASRDVPGNDTGAQRVVRLSATVTFGEIAFIHKGDPLPHDAEIRRSIGRTSNN